MAQQFDNVVDYGTLRWDDFYMKNSTMVSVVSASFGAILFLIGILGIMGSSSGGFLVASVVFALFGGAVFLAAFIVHKLRTSQLHYEIETFLSSTDTEPSQ